jgi:hypothetical protein
MRGQGPTTGRALRWPRCGWRGMAGGRLAEVVAVADGFAAWVIAVLADAARKNLTALVLGTEQGRALGQAATAAVAATAAHLYPHDTQRADELGMAVTQVFSGPVPLNLVGGQPTILQGLGTGIAAKLAVLDDTTLTGTGQSSAQVLGIPGTVIAQVLTVRLLRETTIRGAGGGSLFPLASQLNDDATHLQGQRLEGMLGLASRGKILRASDADLGQACSANVIPGVVSLVAVHGPAEFVPADLLPQCRRRFSAERLWRSRWLVAESHRPDSRTSAGRGALAVAVLLPQDRSEAASQ